jgi:hypothetical protein
MTRKNRTMMDEHLIDSTAERDQDRHFRQLLADYDEPVALDAPPAIRHRLLAHLPAVPPAQAAAQARQRAWWRLAGGATAATVLLALLALGSWGVFIDSAALAQVFGATSAGLGHLVLALVLLAKPIVYSLLGDIGIGIIGWLLACGVLFWGWSQIMRQAPLMHPSRIRVDA